MLHLMLSALKYSAIYLTYLLLRGCLFLPVSFRPEQSHVLQHRPDIQVLIRKLRSGIFTLLLLCMFRTATQVMAAAPVTSYELTLFNIFTFNKPAANCRLALLFFFHYIAVSE